MELSLHRNRALQNPRDRRQPRNSQFPYYIISQIILHYGVTRAQQIYFMERLSRH